MSLPWRLTCNSQKGIKETLNGALYMPAAPSNIANICRKIFCLYEVDDFIFDPVVRMIALGILDDAFELGFELAEDIFKLRVDRHRQTMRLRWKASWENKPVFRQAVPTSDGIQTSKDEPLRYHTFLYYLQRLGMMAGMMKILNPYSIRRGTGEAVDGEPP